MRDNTNKYELNVLVNGKRIQEYKNDGKTFIEGRKGSSFELEFRNHSRKRVCFIPSVDGLSVLDGQTAGLESPGYIVEPWGSLKVPGWKLDSESVAQFVFETAGQSYSSQMGYGQKNTGVIGAMVFEEKNTLDDYSKFRDQFLRDYGEPKIWPRRSPIDPWWMHNYNDYTFIGSSTMNAATESMSIKSCDMHENDSEESLGTGFGRRESFSTHKVEFEKKNPNVPDAKLAIYYDSRKNLEKRGIQVLPEGKFKFEEPDPFPNHEGCPIPPGWNG